MHGLAAVGGVPYLAADYFSVLNLARLGTVAANESESYSETCDGPVSATLAQGAAVLSLVDLGAGGARNT